MSDYVSAKAVVAGLVQGVGFRWFTITAAKQLGITGWVRNRFDGAVELEAEGPRGAVEALLKEVRTGPRHASVRDLHVEYGELTGKYKTFEARF